MNNDDSLQVIAIGDHVRSYDFPWRSDNCYVEGLVVEIGRFPEFPDCDRYKIKVERRMWDGREETFEGESFVYPPVNGAPCWLGGVTAGVVKIQPKLKPRGANDDRDRGRKWLRPSCLLGRAGRRREAAGPGQCRRSRLRSYS